MQFRTEIPVLQSECKIDYHSGLLLLGSCFAENIGSKFEYYKFQAHVNPFGIIFNAVSLEKLVKRVVEKDYFAEKDIFFHNDLWHCYEVHSELSNPNKEEFLKELNQLIDSVNQQIHKLTHCLITLGTSWVYRLRETEQIVANCHKVPQKEFTKELLSVEENELSLQTIVSLIQSINSDVKFIFTVSPVRHIKDGFFENNVSKGNLFSAINILLSSRSKSRDKIQNKALKVFDSGRTESSINYFPSYEMVMDELRDYRFFEADMLHPNRVAIDYIWEKFSQSFFTAETASVMKSVEAIQKGLAHKPFNPDTEQHILFLNKLEGKIQMLQSQFPFLKFS
ncbi:GSCFA domain-containing protein [Flavobacterium sp. NRK F10]|uniref:GSCFA domain-containing protein n=1 Tax=Flavobacterium sediminis TaxID=2201181 RepID=A0A2U8QVT0_9FLAO|nr:MULTISPECIES: GSCFA domain-containing protein [Flavobacterium]AWM14233.1 GSCFA domain-containing protein [Flavobacterium sediminis]MCO6175434.1 GSCFA domain-containing protein [Flavobacterium sp. NRK F10]